MQNFYSHALVGRDERTDLAHLQDKNFYSHALVGRDIGAIHDIAYIMISTHTPSWGVTVSRPPEGNPAEISTHTPSWGVTAVIRIMDAEYKKFLLTRPRGA